MINTGAQDHRWLGNCYFHERGAEIISLKRTVESQKYYVDRELAALRRVIGEDRLAGTMPYYADRQPEGNEAELVLGGVRVKLLWPGPGHFPDDAVVIVPSEDTIFTGDLVFVERLLGIQGDGTSSQVRAWLESFHRIAAMKPKHIVPGHGHACDLARAEAETGAYLEWLVEHVGEAVENFDDLEETADRLKHSPFEHLKNYEGLHRHNVYTTFLQFEAE